MPELRYTPASLGQLPHEAQAIWFLNAYRSLSIAEDVWSACRRFEALHKLNRSGDSMDLNPVAAARFLEEGDETLTRKEVS